MTYCRRWPSQGQRTGDNSTINAGFYVKAKQVTARGRGRKNLGRGRSSLVIVNEGSGSFSGKPYFQGEP